MNNLHIAISSDSNYLMQATIFARSVAENNLRDFDTVTIHLLARDISSTELEKFHHEITSFGLNLTVYDISNIRQMLGVDIPATISISSYARLFLSSLLSDEIDRVIYTDVDALNIGSFTDLWQMDMTNCSVAGVLDVVSDKAKSFIGLDVNAPYVNAGFLLINLDYWRKHDFENRFRQFLIDNNGNVFHHDQGIINAVCNSSLKILPPQYNVVSSFFMNYNEIGDRKPFYSKSEIETAIQSTVFVHFTPGVVNRPWVKNCRHPLKDKYLEYKALTSYADSELPYDNRPLKLRFLSALYFNCRPMYYFILKLRGYLSSKI